MFEKAARLKLRFDSSRGQLSAEDLWDLPLTALNLMAIDLLKKKQTESVSFIQPTEQVDPKVTLAFDLVVYVIKTRQEERDLAETARTRSAKKQQLLAILARKEESALSEMTPEELQKMIEEM